MLNLDETTSVLHLRLQNWIAKSILSKMNIEHHSLQTMKKNLTLSTTIFLLGQIKSLVFTEKDETKIYQTVQSLRMIITVKLMRVVYDVLKQFLSLTQVLWT